MDEVSLGAATLVGEYKDGGIREYEIHPEDFGLTMASSRAFKVETPEQSRALMQAVLDNEVGPARDIVILNTGAAPELVFEQQGQARHIHRPELFAHLMHKARL